MKKERRKRRKVNPPCIICDQRKNNCEGRQIKHLSKGCQVLMGHIVENGTDFSIVMDVADLLKPTWYTKNGEGRRVTVSRRILNDLKREEEHMQTADYGEYADNARYNRDHKRNIRL
jgi:hypothetical protein